MRVSSDGPGPGLQAFMLPACRVTPAVLTNSTATTHIPSSTAISTSQRTQTCPCRGRICSGVCVCVCLCVCVATVGQSLGPATRDLELFSFFGREGAWAHSAAVIYPDTKRLNLDSPPDYLPRYIATGQGQQWGAASIPRVGALVCAAGSASSFIYFSCACPYRWEICDRIVGLLWPWGCEFSGCSFCW